MFSISNFESCRNNTIRKPAAIYYLVVLADRTNGRVIRTAVSVVVVVVCDKMYCG